MNRATPDFNAYVANVRRFMESQDEMMDFDFDGSALSFLVKALAYDATNQGYMNTMMFNELHRSAELRENLGTLFSFNQYIPGSVRGSVGKVNIVVTPSDPFSAPNEIVLSRYDKFTASSDGNVYPFTPVTDYTATLVNDVYTFTDVELIQGKRIVSSFDVKGTAIVTNVIPNERIDITSLKVSVRESDTIDTLTDFERYINAYDLGVDKNIFYLSLTRQNLYAIEFGDGVLSNQLQDGNIVLAEYVVSQGAGSNGVKTILPMSSIDGYTNIDVTVTQVPSGGREAETADEIRMRAPRTVWTGGAAISPDDYKDIVVSMPEVKDAISWGGELNVPPKSGSIFVAVIPETGSVDQTLKTLVVDEIKRHHIGSLNTVVVPADVTYVDVSTTVSFDTTFTNHDEDSIQVAVTNAIRDFSDQSLQSFGAGFDFSVLSDAINDTDASVVGNVTSVEFIKRIVPELFFTGSYMTTFNREIGEGTVLIDDFDAEEGGGSLETYIKDEDGKLYLYRIEEAGEHVRLKQVGTVNYATGSVNISSIRVIATDNGYMSVHARSLTADNNLSDEAGVYIQIGEIDTSVKVKGGR